MTFLRVWGEQDSKICEEEGLLTHGVWCLIMEQCVDDEALSLNSV